MIRTTCAVFPLFWAMYRAAALLGGIVSSLYFSADGIRDAAANDGLYLIFLALVVFGASLTGRFIPRPFEHSHHALDALLHINVPGYHASGRITCLSQPSPSRAHVPLLSTLSGVITCERLVSFSPRCLTCRLRSWPHLFFADDLEAISPMDRFELLRRAKDLVVGLGDADGQFGKLPGLFCQFDKTTGWPVYSMNADGGPVPDGICKIDETAARGISLRQLLVLYELVKQHCAAEGWTNWAGELLTPEAVNLYDLNKYVIMPATEAHQCSYVELVTGAGDESARRCPDGHVPMARAKVYKDFNTFQTEEVSCTQCTRKLESGATYWVCHRCGEKHKMCGACAPAPAPVKCAELQAPLWFVSHWYGRRRSLPQLAEPRSHVPRSKQVGGARLLIHRVPPPARPRPVLHRRRRRLVARYPVLGVRVREQPACVRLPPPRVFPRRYHLSLYASTPGTGLRSALAQVLV